MLIIWLIFSLIILFSFICFLLLLTLRFSGIAGIFRLANLKADTFIESVTLAYKSPFFNFNVQLLDIRLE